MPDSSGDDEDVNVEVGAAVHGESMDAERAVAATRGRAAAEAAEAAARERKATANERITAAAIAEAAADERKAAAGERKAAAAVVEASAHVRKALADERAAAAEVLIQEVRKGLHRIALDRFLDLSTPRLSHFVTARRGRHWLCASRRNESRTDEGLPATPVHRRSSVAHSCCFHVPARCSWLFRFWPGSSEQQYFPVTEGITGTHTVLCRLLITGDMFGLRSLRCQRCVRCNCSSEAVKRHDA